MKKTLIFMLFLVLFAGCSGYTIKTETSKMQSGKNFKTIVVQWVDLHTGDWKKYGYKNEESWKLVIDNVNIRTFIPELETQMTGKKIIGLKKNDTFPDTGDIYITFNVKKITREFNGFSGGSDKCHLDVVFTDIKSKTKIYQADLVATSQAPYIKSLTFENRLRNTFIHLAEFLASKLNK